MEYFNCELYEPITWENVSPATSTDFWQFSKLQCEIPYQTTISDGTSTFYYFNTIGTGDLLIIFFLILFLAGGIFKFLWSFWITPYIRFKKLERKLRFEARRRSRY